MRRGKSKEFRPAYCVPVEPRGIPNSRFHKMTKYLKRSGTSGIQGHLYETKLLSLIYFRAIHDDSIEEFHLATNVDKLGSFDDICFRIKFEENDKPLSVFIQAKHRENNTVLTLNSKNDLVTHFNSYLQIRSKFEPNNKDVLFSGTFDNTECLFVIYTTAKGDRPARKYEGSSATFLNALIGTEVLGSGLQPLDESKQAELNQILLEEEMAALARHMAMCIYGEFKDVQMLILEDVVLRYHAVLAQQVFDVSMEQSRGLRDAHIRQDFFDMNEEILQLFKEKLCTEILRRHKFVSGTSLRLRYTPACCVDTDIDNEYQEIKQFIIYENQKFEFLDKIGSARYKPFLDKINESQETIRRTLEIAVKECLPSTFGVPAWFGNKDLMIRGSDEKQQRKLIDLTSKFVGFIEKSRPSNIVIVDESLGDGFLQLNGGIASSVGNLLVLDDMSKLLKFNDNHESLGKLAKKLFDNLNCTIENLYEFKFDIRAKIFPKLSFDADEYTKNIVKDFSEKLLFYTAQAKEAKVETILINEIKDNIRCRRDDIYTRNIKSNIIFLTYHDAIQKWWMKKEGEYLAKGGSLYENAEKHALNQPLTSCLNMIQKLNSKNYVFTEDAVNSLKLDDQPSGTVIITKNITLTVAKLINHLIKKDCVMLDMQNILNLSTYYDVEKLQTELVDLSKENILIVACDKAIFGTKSDKKIIEKTAKSIRNETAIIILNDEYSVENASIYFTQHNTIIKDERNNLIDMSEESQKSVLENTDVMFQGVEVHLNQVVDNKSLGLVGEVVLLKLMQSDTNIIGKSVSKSNFKGTIYIERSVQCLKVKTRGANDRKIEEGEIKSISTLSNLEVDVVLVIGDPGMGKSTLLTQLSLKTKQVDTTDWILRINLLEYSKQLFYWQDNETVIDALESLKFLCQVALSEESIKNNDIEISLEELDGTVSLKDCDGDDWTVFELKMFLHYYNTKQLIILFDGFDEICPDYAHEVLSLIKVVMNLRHKHKIWIASRSYDKIIAELDLQVFYKIVPLNYDEQDLFLTTFWKKQNLDEKKLRNSLSDFSKFMSQSDDLLLFKKKSHLPDDSINEKPMLAVYLSLYKYLKPKMALLGSKDIYKEPKSQFNGLAATPLHLHMLAEHLYNRIIGKDTMNDERYKWMLVRERLRVHTIVHADGSESSYSDNSIDEMEAPPIKWDLDLNLFEIYEHVLKYKLKIRFQEKYKTDTCKPDNGRQYERAHKDTKDILKKLAAYVVYNKRLLDRHELERCNEIIKKLKEGEENTDFICNVVNGIPVFVHSTFAEYFAVEYICELMESQQNLINIYNFILNVMFFTLNKNVLVMFDAKIKVDIKLTSIIEMNKGIIFRLLLEQGKITKNKHGYIKSSLCEAIRLGLRNFAFLLLSTIGEYLCESNLMDFIEMVRETNMLMIAVKMGFDESLITIINQVRKICESKLNALFENIEIFDKNENLARESTSDLVQKLHANVWTRMNIVPDWKILRKSDLGGQIYFI